MIDSTDIAPRFIGYEHADNTLGAHVVAIGAPALVMTGYWAARAANSSGRFADTGTVAYLLG